MRYVCSAAAALVMAAGSLVWGQPQGLSIANYQSVSTQIITSTMSRTTWRADVVNNGGPLAGVTATLTSLDPFSIRVIPGLETLQFANVPSNSQVTSSNTFTILTPSGSALDSSKLQWTFQASAPTGGGPLANAGPNQTSTVGSTVTLNGSGSTNPSGAGALTYNWEFLSRPAGSTAFLRHSSTVMPSFTLDVAGAYVITLTVSNGAAGSSANVTVSTASTPPVANAGPNQTVALGSNVILNGAGSTSASGNPLTYAWTLISRPPGSTAVLNGAASVSPTFVTDRPGSYQATLVVNDGIASSNPATVTITTQVVKPVANAGPGQMVNVNSLVQLNGAGSTDANGLPLTYQWTLLNAPQGSSAVLSNPVAVNPSFTADRPGTYIAQLVVNNGQLSSDASTVTITTQSATLQPTANAGPNQNTAVNSQVTLNGSGTDPQNLPLTFQWLLVSKPQGSAASLSSTVIANPVFTADLAGNYVAQLTVNNGVLSSAASTVTITTSCAQPLANAGPDRSTTTNATVTLDGSASSDMCRQPLTYAWTFTARPNGSAATLSGASTVAPTFTPDVAGTYVVQLIVNNGTTSSNPSTATITVASAVPPASSDIVLPANVTVPPGQSTQFPVTLSKAAPGGGVFIALTTSDPSKATVAPAFIIISQGLFTPSRPPLVTGVNAGVAVITATAFGLAPASQQVQVGTPPATAMSFSPAGLIVNAGNTQNFTLTLTPPPAATLAVTFNSSNSSAATVPPILSVPANVSSINVPVTGVAAGSATITASGPGYPGALAGVTVLAVQPAAITVPANSSVGLGQSSAFPIGLTVAAPNGGLNVTLTSTDTSKVTVTGSVFIAAGATAPLLQPQVNGIGLGSAGINVSAPGYTSASGQIQVTGGGGSSSFSPGTVSVNVGLSQTLTLNLTGPAPAGLTASLTSSNPGAATVPGNVTFAQGATSAIVTVTGTGAGAASITASTPNFGNATANVNVSGAPAGIIMPANAVVPLGDSLLYPVSLATGAPEGGVFITLTSSDTSKLTVAPANIFIRQGATAPNSPPKISGVGAGSASITATAMSFTPTTQLVQVGSAAALGLSPGNLTLVQNGTQNLTLSLPSPAPVGGLTIAVSSNNPAVASVPGSVIVSSFGTSVNIPVTGVAPGAASITASAPGFTSATASVVVSGLSSIILPANVTLGPGGTTDFPVTLGAGAPSGGVFVNLTSSDPSKVGITPSTIFFAQGSTTSATIPKVSGISLGSATITGSAAGVGSASQQVSVTSASGFQPETAVITGIATKVLTLVLSAPAPAGLVLDVSSSDTNVANVPATIAVPVNATSLNIPVTSVGAGTAFIQAGSPPVFPNAVATVKVVNSPSIILPGFDAIGIRNVINFPVSLSTPAPQGGVTVTLTSSDVTKFTITPSVFIPGGATTPVSPARIASGDTVFDEGFSTVTASAPGYASASLEMHIYDAITIGVPYNLSVSLGQSVPLPIALPGPAPGGGVTLTITSTNPAVVVVTPTAFVPGGSNFPVTLPLITGTGFGSVTIDVAASGYISGAQRLQVTGNVRFSPANLVMVGNATQNLTLILGGPAPAGGLTVTLGSSNPTVASVPSTATFAAGEKTVIVPVSGAGTGTAVISAGFTSFPNVPVSSTVVTRQ